MSRPTHIEEALWLEDNKGRLTLTADWKLERMPQVHIGGRGGEVLELEHEGAEAFMQASGYASLAPGSLVFEISQEALKQLNEPWERLYLGCEFNGWGQATDLGPWELRPQGNAYRLELDNRQWNLDQQKTFKFFTDRGFWIPVPEQAPNKHWDEDGNSNYVYWPHKTGQHRFHFTLPNGMNPWALTLFWSHTDHGDWIPVCPGPALLNFHTSKRLGASVSSKTTTFRLFSPRATNVWVGWRPGAAQPWQWAQMRGAKDGTWSHSVSKSLVDYQYAYRVEGPKGDPYGHWDAQQLILDPYARACAHPAGPGIIVNPKRLEPAKHAFKTPDVEDLVIVEAHVRDLLGLNYGGANALGFEELTHVLKTRTNYLKALGVNAVEFQPLQEFDAPTHHDYHWGYMPTNAFCPASSLAKNPQKASQIEAMKALVAACHQAGLAVILDVVYNHVGEPNPFLFIDKYLYFRLEPNGKLQNASGCGNDLRCESPMVTQWIIESLKHWVQTYGVDGFRFDLAELLTVPVLKEIEKELRAVKPNVVLIAEPWSFRGHCAQELKTTSYASWNDGFREFIADYILGKGNQEGIRYFFAGSTDHLVENPYQSINYTQSHDDWTWIDRITQQAHNQGQTPTSVDRRRTHLMLALLMASLGTPMLASGQDMLHSKEGVHNTYQRGDLNALSLERLLTYTGTHAYTKNWISLRRSKIGKLLRLKKRPSPEYLQFFHPPHRSAFAVLINADHSYPEAKHRLLFALNPHEESLPIGLPELPEMTLLADAERVDTKGLSWPEPILHQGTFTLPPLSCFLYQLD